MPEFQTIFRLGRRPGEGVFCDADGFLVGDVALLERSSSLSDAQGWRPRALAELNRDLSGCYGLPIEVEPKAGGLEVIARALGRGDLAQAQMTALHLRFPDPPDLEKSAGDVQAMIDLARRLEESGLLKGEWDPDQHPRWPQGSQDSAGGRFAPGGSQGAGGGEASANTRNHRSHLASSGSRRITPQQQAANRARSELQLANPKVQALLSVIADKESRGKYNAIYGGQTFSDYSKHPNIHGPSSTSTAAGAFQFNYKTWKEVSPELGLTDFSPASQRLAAAYLLNRIGAIDKIENGNIAGAIFAAAERWDSMPIDATGKSKNGYSRPLTPIIDSYKAALAALPKSKEAP